MHSQQLRPVNLYCYFFGTAEFDEARFELRVNGLPVAIERRPLFLLAKILEHADQVVTKKELLQTVWSGRITVDNVLANAMAKLRKALGENAQLLITIPRVGYRVKGPVRKMEAGADCDIIPRSSQGFAYEDTQFIISRLPPRPQPFYHLDVISLNHVKDIGPDIGSGTQKYDTDHTQPYAHSDFNTLEEWTGRHQLLIMPVERRLDLFMSVAKEVSMQHSKGTVHSFLSPDTVLISEDGKVRIIAPTGSVSSPNNAEYFHHASCKCFYRAPETYRNYGISQRSDIYSLGVILYQMLISDFSRPLLPDWRQDLTDRSIQHTIESATHSCPSLRAESVEDMVKCLYTHRVGHTHKSETWTLALANMFRK